MQNVYGDEETHGTTQISSEEFEDWCECAGIICMQDQILYCRAATKFKT